jgi:hypothetical protein
MSNTVTEVKSFRINGLGLVTEWNVTTDKPLSTNLGPREAAEMTQALMDAVQVKLTDGAKFAGLGFGLQRDVNATVVTGTAYTYHE